MRIEIDRDVCIGSGVCALTAPDLFAQDPEDGRALTRSEALTPEQLETARRVVGLCPSGALSLVDDRV